MVGRSILTKLLLFSFNCYCSNPWIHITISISHYLKSFYSFISIPFRLSLLENCWNTIFSSIAVKVCVTQSWDREKKTKNWIMRKLKNETNTNPNNRYTRIYSLMNVTFVFSSASRAHCHIRWAYHLVNGTLG